jgi:nucleotide-binding universal stress UspA family protein
MFLPKRILSPIDFSDSSLEALYAARDLAAHYSSDLLLVHAVPVIPDDTSILHETADEETLIEAARRRLTELAEKLKAQGLRASATIGLANDAASEILRVAEAEGIDLIVIATHGMTGLRHLAFGSVAEKVVRTAACPVLFLRNSAATRSGDANVKSAATSA